MDYVYHGHTVPRNHSRCTAITTDCVHVISGAELQKVKDACNGRAACLNLKVSHSVKVPCDGEVEGVDYMVIQYHCVVYEYG